MSEHYIQLAVKLRIAALQSSICTCTIAILNHARRPYCSSSNSVPATVRVAAKRNIITDAGLVYY
eukprot:810-Heterococcus_DN1.PRE.3